MSSSTGPSPLFVPLNPSPRLVAQMTGLSLRQSELEVSQQINLKRMLRRIRASRRMALSGSPRSLRHRHRKPVMPTLQLPGALVPDHSEDADEWRDEEASVERMDIFMDISDDPRPSELHERAARLFNQVFAPEPAVRGSQVRVRRLSGAMTNCVFMMTIDPVPSVPSSRAPKMLMSTRQYAKGSGHTGKHTTPLPKKYLLRVYGTGVDEFLSRTKELYWLSQLTSLGFGPQLYGIFGNGRLEEFLESTTLTKDDIRHPSTSKHIARRMCELHSLVSYYRPYGDVGASSHPGVDLSGRPELWANVDSWLRLVHNKWSLIRRTCDANPQCAEILDNWPRLEQAAARLRRYIGRANAPVVFAHDDLQYGNILRLEHTGELVVVDFEYAGYNYRGFDIANHFCEWTADYHHPDHPHLLNESLYPDVTQREGFLRTYVKAKAFLDANMRADAEVVESDSDRLVDLRAIRLSEDRIRDEVAALDREVAFFVPASHLHWGIWGLLQACSSEIDFDYVGYAAQRLSIFLRQVADLEE
ncbi:hypothetical protein GGI25_006137 [Coemansia spiralis]|uniref:Uncharacterized protein n=2 Tax=Coemansia TaxID=4863 RepID=A0A9W8G114_9FUNG|nr:kinase-like domain-containing protein [Coemansia spiralis]KAJ1986890.1 hypothetical protein EDC05_006099 [Coemansia umbellata]KAJ2618947.1 hypothetical protein GGI26_006232 [Coemansia sp. RSA 1358]KAJ2669490.1 hypothetical protein GGI25_006137 [Coemansia spiralis]